MEMVATFSMSQEQVELLRTLNESLMQVQKHQQGWLNVEQAAKYAGDVSASTIRRWRDSGKLNHSRIGELTLIKVSDLDTYLEQHKVPAYAQEYPSPKRKPKS